MPNKKIRIVVEVDGKKYRADLNRVSKDTEKFAGKQKNAAAATSQLNGCLKTAVGLFAAYKLVGIIRDSTLFAARTETLGVVLGVVGRNIGLTRDEMLSYAEGVKEMDITTEASRTTVVRMAQANPDLAKSSELARDAAVVGNVNSSVALTRLIHGITTLQPKILRTIGISVTFEQEYARVAKQLDRTADSFTQVEKKNIALNAVLRESKTIAGALKSINLFAGTADPTVRDRTYANELQILQASQAAMTSSFQRAQKQPEIDQKKNQLQQALIDLGGPAGIREEMARLDDELEGHLKKRDEIIAKIKAAPREEPKPLSALESLLGVSNEDPRLVLNKQLANATQELAPLVGERERLWKKLEDIEFAGGSDGPGSTGGNCLPREHIALYRAVAVENDIAKGRRIMSALMPFMGILEQGGKLIQVIKYACELKGLPSGPVRKPLQSLSGQEKKEVEQVLATLEETLSGIDC